jgi:formylglycine-generating enzyme required for sulfatase activity
VAAACAAGLAVATALAAAASRPAGRYVHVDLRGPGTLSLAEVQVFSGGVNVALKGKAVQTSTGAGGVPSRGIDGNTNGDWGCSSITHTVENGVDPAWEVDLGGVKAIERIVVWNRNGLESRLDGFRMSILDEKRRVVCEKTTGTARTGATYLAPASFKKSRRLGKAVPPIPGRKLVVGKARDAKAATAPVDDANWYVKKDTWWETLVVSVDAMYDEIEKVEKETLDERAADPAVGKFRPVAIECPKDCRAEYRFAADVSGMKTVFMGVDLGDWVSFNGVIAVDEADNEVPLPVSGRGAIVAGMTGRRQLRAGRGGEGASFTLNATTLALALDGQYKSIEGTFTRGSARNTRPFRFTVASSHPEEFTARLESWRQHLEKRVYDDFRKDPRAAREMEAEIKKARLYQKLWKRGDYADAVGRLVKVASPSVKARVAEIAKTATSMQDLAEAREVMARGAKCDEILAQLKYGARPLVMAIDDLTRTFGDRYPKGSEYLARAKRYGASLPRIIDALKAGDVSVADEAAEFQAFQRKALLDNPLLDFDKLLLTRGSIGLSSNWGGSNRLGNELVSLSPVSPDGEVTVLHKGTVSSFDLSFDGGKVLFSDGAKIMEVGVDGSGLRTVLKSEARCYNPCRLPSGKIMFVSTACEQAVPCTGGAGVGNMHVMNDDGTGERRITYDQDHNWDPCMLANGRVVYTRWEYTDIPHYFTRLLMSMNPDGTDQKEYYGSSSYWPNAMYWTRPIPGESTKVVCIVSGHHGVSRMGELLVLDPAKGRFEADGVVQRIPGWGQKVEPIIRDNLVGNSWPRFITPWPLAEPGTNAGAGKYFLVTAKMTPSSGWGLYIVDVFDNMVPIVMGGYAMPTPLRPRVKPPVMPERVNIARRDANVYIFSVYEGPGLKGYPRGSVKALRVASHHFRYPGNGDTGASAYEGGWDPKRILGTVPVHEDGSAFFKVPANTPLFVQPLDAEGKSLQVMRSWFTAMPGETLSCIGCHERQNDAPPARVAAASRHAPTDIEPWHGPVRGFSYNREVQPVLDRRCVGCHNGQPRKDSKSIPDLRAQRLQEKFTGKYSPSYMVLQNYVRRAGFESDYHVPNPAEYEADTSALVQMLKKGHNNVRLTREEWERLYTWIDFNIPYAANWRESHKPPKPSQVEKRAKFLKLYANIVDQNEDPVALPEIPPFEAPAATAAKPAAASLDGWPMDAGTAAEKQKQCGLEAFDLELEGGLKMRMQPVPAGKFVMGAAGCFADEDTERVVSIDKPFFMAEVEVTNEIFAKFDPDHDSRYIDGRGKDRTNRGRPINGPKYPVVRVTWKRAAEFCEWLSEKTGRKCSLPTEEQWEYACRAGRSGPLPRGRKSHSSFPGGRAKPNAWQIRDMEGNVAEWTSSVYDPLRAAPYQEAGRGVERRVVRGSTWDDRLRMAPTTTRWRYPTCQPVYNVGFRVVCEASDAPPA